MRKLSRTHTEEKLKQFDEQVNCYGKSRTLVGLATPHRVDVALG